MVTVSAGEVYTCPVMSSKVSVPDEQSPDEATGEDGRESIRKEYAIDKA